MVFDGFTGESGHIVILVSPLLSLIKDQTERLRQVGLSCISLSDASTQGEIDLVKEDFIRLFTRRQIGAATYILLVLKNKGKGICLSREQERCVTTLITAAKETTDV